jgi:membrane-bound lytic murein transglycosylase B
MDYHAVARTGVRRLTRFILPAACAAAVASLASAQETTPPFADWLAGFGAEAREAGVSEATIKAALGGLEPLPIVVERDSTQAELTLSIDRYLARRLTPATVGAARRLRAQHARVLGRVAQAYGVPPSVLVAVWGLESNFGRFSGRYPTIAALATLAYDGRRASFFRGELLEALRILDGGTVTPERLTGSWAGAMGQPQFMPSSYVRYAVDFDKDGQANIWQTHADVFASIANYLKDKGWTEGERWGREVVVPPRAAARIGDLTGPRPERCSARREMEGPLPLADWLRLGVTLPRGRPLPSADLDAWLVTAGRRSFLVYRNYSALLEYNCAHAYALSVGLLSDMTEGR